MNYLRLYWVFLKRSFVANMEFKVDFFIGVAGFFVQNLAYILTIFFIVNSIPSLNGWNMYQMGFLYGFTLMPIAVDHLFTDELWRIAYFRVARGDVDCYFLRPVSVLFQIIAERFQPDALGELVLGIVMMAICGSKCGIVWSWEFVLLFIVATFCGAVCITSIKIFGVSFAWVFKRSGYIIQILYNFRQYARYPLSIFPKVIRYMLTFVLPFGLISSLPVETLFFNNHGALFLSLKIFLMSAAQLTFALIVWRINISKYESTGS